LGISRILSSRIEDTFIENSGSNTVVKAIFGNYFHLLAQLQSAFLLSSIKLQDFPTPGAAAQRQ
jgi:hypothetical protein